MTKPVVCTGSHQQAAVLSFVGDALKDPEIQALMGNMSDRKRETYRITLDCLKVYEIGGKIHVRARDIGILMNISGIEKRIEKMTRGEEYAIEDFDGKPTTFLTESGIVSIVYRGNSVAAKSLKKLFTKMILEVCRDNQASRGIVKSAIVEDTEMMMDFIDVMDDAAHRLKELYENERLARLAAEDNCLQAEYMLRCEQQTTRELEDKLLYRDSEIRYIEQMRLDENPAFLTELMDYHMSPVYVTVMDSSKFGWLKFRLPDGVDYDRYDSLARYCQARRTILEGYDFLFRICAKEEPNSIKFRLHAAKQIETLRSKIEDEPSLRIVRQCAASTYVYGSGEQLRDIMLLMLHTFPEPKI